MKVITLMTDFGELDPYVGVMKGVILKRTIEATIVDITHSIGMGDVRTAAFFLRYYPAYFPKGSVHIIVVDPGVGGERRALVNEKDGSYFVAPDNGVLTPVLGRVYEIKKYTFTSNTFHGRDVFAPAAADIVRGIHLSKIGKMIKNPIKIKMPEPVVENSVINGEVMHIDHFGNIITNIDSKFLQGKVEILYKSNIIDIAEFYSQKEENEPLGVINSYGLLEISINEGSAAKIFKARVGDKVVVRRKNE